MAEYTFICVEFNELNQTFMTSERLDKSNDKILIADNWKVGCLSGDKTSGYLGSGSSKDVIYVCFLPYTVIQSYNICVRPVTMVVNMPLVKLKLVSQKPQMKIPSRRNIRTSSMPTGLPMTSKIHFEHQACNSLVPLL